MPVTLSLPRSRSRFPSSTPLSHRRSQIKPLPSAPLTRSPILPKRGSGECDYRRQSYSFGASPKITTHWSRGTSIGCHSDDNKRYLKQWHFAVRIPLSITPLFY
ncbi:hypothetical protein AAHE18_16G147500 [Arachis hypogaea]